MLWQQSEALLAKPFFFRVIARLIVPKQPPLEPSRQIPRLRL
ncbi:MAG: hypothetical protein WCO51_03790 [bacterium]